MKYYTFNSTTGEFENSGIAVTDPRESVKQNKKIYLLPANATWQAPGENKSGFAQVWNGAAWEYIPDHRGETVWTSYDECVTITSLGEIPAEYSITRPEKAVTIDDYDMAMESYLAETRRARGYTTREPDFYLNSEVPRWAQDAKDWIKFRDAVMLYGLEVQNNFAATGNAPGLVEFIDNMPKIKWTFEV